MGKLKLLDEKKNFYNENKHKISKKLAADISKDFLLKFANDTTKIEGNTMSYYESKTVLEDGYAIGGKSLREHFELINSKEAFEFIETFSDDFSESFIKDIHEILMDNIFPGGIYRTTNVRMGGANTIPPSWEHVREDMKFFISDFNKKKDEMHPIELACWVHAEFVRIHPFIDGDGRTARLLMNYILMFYGFVPVSIKPVIVSEYYSALDDFGCGGNLTNFVALVAKLEEERLDEYITEIKSEEHRILKMDLV